MAKARLQAKVIAKKLTINGRNVYPLQQIQAAMDGIPTASLQLQAQMPMKKMNAQGVSTLRGDLLRCSD
jgi:hypothetical protein